MSQVWSLGSGPLPSWRRPRFQSVINKVSTECSATNQRTNPQSKQNAVAFNSLFLFRSFPPIHLRSLLFPLNQEWYFFTSFSFMFVCISDCWLARFLFIFSISIWLFRHAKYPSLLSNTFLYTNNSHDPSSPPLPPPPSLRQQHKALPNLHTLLSSFPPSLLPLLPPTPHVEAVVVVAVVVALPPDARSFSCPTFLCTALIRGSVRSCHPSYSRNTPRNSTSRSSC